MVPISLPHSNKRDIVPNRHFSNVSNNSCELIPVLPVSVILMGRIKIRMLQILVKFCAYKVIELHFVDHYVVEKDFFLEKNLLLILCHKILRCCVPFHIQNQIFWNIEE